MAPRYGNKNRKPKRKPTTKKQTALIKKVIHKSEPAREIRFTNNGNLTANPTVANSFNQIDLHAIASGTQVNQKLFNKIYVSGVHVKISALNNHTNTRVLRIMIVSHKNPADTLDAGYTDLYESSAFAPKAPDGLQGDYVSPINRDILRIHCDKKFIVKPKTEGALALDFYCPINRKWEYKSVANQSSCTTGKTFLIAQSIELDGTASTNAMTYLGFCRVHYKETE